MITTALLLMFFGFYLNYASSQRMETQSYLGLELWVQKNEKLARVIGAMLLCASLILNSTHYGLGAGTFLSVIALMVMGSLVVLLSPLRLLNHKVLVSVFALCLLIEVFVP